MFRRPPQIKTKPIYVHEGEAFKKMPSIVHLEGMHSILTKLKHKSLMKGNRLKQLANNENQNSRTWVKDNYSLDLQ